MATVPKLVRCKIGKTIYEQIAVEDLRKLPGFTLSALIAFDGSDGWQAAFMVLRLDAKTHGARYPNAIAADPLLQKALNNVIDVTRSGSRPLSAAPASQNLNTQPGIVQYAPGGAQRRPKGPSLKIPTLFCLVVALLTGSTCIAISKGPVIADLISSFLTARAEVNTQIFSHPRVLLAPRRVEKKKLIAPRIANPLKKIMKAPHVPQGRPVAHPQYVKRNVQKSHSATKRIAHRLQHANIVG